MTTEKPMDFHRTLLLNQWIWGFFEYSDLEVLRGLMKAAEEEETPDEAVQTRYLSVMEGQSLFPKLDNATLRTYDARIAGYWKKITANRGVHGRKIALKYFQYLVLLSTEIYLDYYFNKRTTMLAELNAVVEKWNTANPKWKLQPYVESDLNKIAIWAATASGKTLMMHVNLLQFEYYAKAAHKAPDRILLLTPNESLTKQHDEELKLSAIDSNPYKGEGDLFSSGKEIVQILDVNKLSDKKGDKTVAVDSFEGNNLVIVDEGHRGTASEDGVWMGYRQKLCEKGFSFEYSATFGQAVSGKKTILQQLDAENKKRIKAGKSPIEAKDFDGTSLWDLYAKCILFDYSYKYFYRDGYGKESLILNIKDSATGAASEEIAEANEFAYLTACLLTFYQQLYVFGTNKAKMKENNIAQPLLVFVGNSVQKKESAETLSDVANVLKFFSEFLKTRKVDAIAAIKALITDQALMLNGEKKIFAGQFSSLAGRKAEDVYAGIVDDVFHAESGTHLKLTLRTRPGEVALSVGSNPFGVINVGEAAKFVTDLSDEDNRREKDGGQRLFDYGPNDLFSESLFDDINKGNNPDTPSNVTVLIGSRKFTEGWNSWRVSTMGLMNMGKSEGSQVIQLFGRGVRLMGKGFSLKRNPSAAKPLRYVETLNIFGVHANYMTVFKQYLEGEGVKTDDAAVLDITFNAQRPPARRRTLRVLRLPDGCRRNQENGFQRKMQIVFAKIPTEFAGMKQPVYTLDLYPKIQLLEKATAASGDGGLPVKPKFWIPSAAFPFFDWDRIYRKMVQYKAEQNYSNMAISREGIKDFVLPEGNHNHEWYVLYLPPEQQRLDRFDDVRRFEDLLVELLKGFATRFYEKCQDAYQVPMLEYVKMKEDDPLLNVTYHFTAEKPDFNANVTELKRLVESRDFKKLFEDWHEREIGGISVICVKEHLFYPIIYRDKTSKAGYDLKVTPLGIEAPSERKFVLDLDVWCNSDDGKAWLEDKELFLLRNASDKSRGGIGFTLAGGFYPDFLLWVITADGKEHLLFVDPKGLHDMDPTNPKLDIAEAVQKKAEDLHDDTIDMDAFIVSTTPLADMSSKWSWDKTKFDNKHILFYANPVTSDIRESGYIKEMFTLAGLMRMKHEHE